MIKVEQIDNPLMQYIATSNGFQKIRSSWMLPLRVKLYLLRFAWHTVTLSFLRALYRKRGMQRGRFEYWVWSRCDVWPKINTIKTLLRGKQIASNILSLMFTYQLVGRLRQFSWPLESISGDYGYHYAPAMSDQHYFFRFLGLIKWYALLGLCK